MAFPFNTPYVNTPSEPVRDVSNENPGHIRLKPGELSAEQIAELMQGAEVYTKEVLPQ